MMILFSGLQLGGLGG